MNRNERDALEAEKVQAIHRLADVGRRLERTLDAPRRAELDETAAAGDPPMRRLFGGERGAIALLTSIPGFAALWERAVPDGRVQETLSRDGERWQIVRCMCGEYPALRPGAIGDCPGGCGRYFFATGRTVRVKQFELAGADAAAA